MHLIVGFLFVGIPLGLKPLIEFLPPGELLGAGLLAGGEELFELAAGGAGVGVHAVFELVRVAHGTPGCVRFVVDVAAVDVDSLAVADVGDVEDDLLCAGGRCGNDRAEDRDG